MFIYEFKYVFYCQVSASPSRVTRSMRTRGVVSPIVEVVQLDSDDNDDMPISSTKRQTRASSRARSAAREVEAPAPSKVLINVVSNLFLTFV